MPEGSSFVLALTWAQALAAALVASLLFASFRLYRKTYLFHWALGWSALAVFHATERLVPAVAGMAGWLQSGWLLFGTFELVRRRPVRLRLARRTLVLLAILGALAGALAPPGLHGVVAGTASAVAAWWLFRARARRGGIGITFAAVALFASSLQLFATVVFIGSFQLPYAELVLQALLGASMIACLLDDEREAAELAAYEIEHVAYHDALTGLPNRPLFTDRLIVALAQGNRFDQKLAVFFLDLDRFKDINDSLGHSAGDSLLKAVSERIRSCIREGDTVARFGGDEFTLLIPGVDHIEEAAKIAEKIIETLKVPFVINGQELFVTTSIGISISPHDGVDPEALVRNADTAMYRAKDQGRDNYQLYAPEMNARALERLALENRLRRALKQKELTVHYQPMIDLQSGVITGVEALVRWRHPELGLLPPAHFISTAERSGLILPIGDWVLRTACRQVQAWNHLLGLDLTVSVNLSARQFSQPELVAQVRNALQETGLEPELLELEITENNAMQNAENTIRTLRELKAAGVRISMDDFGTGYSSLNYLKRFPIDTLKLDRSFVCDSTTDASDAAIISAVIVMAHSLELKVVAEGVETGEQLEFLRQHDCDTIQGFYFSPPLAAEELEPYLVERKAAVQ